MTSSRIFLLGSSAGSLTPMNESAYASEDILQRLLAEYPDLLPGDQIMPEAPRRWLLVAREMGIPDTSETSDRWSLDHLYLDQDGIPTFVECKRASDTRARREVVAQMLEYAANGLSYWSIDRIRQAAFETAQRRGSTFDSEVQTLLGSEVDVEEFWKRVEDNLRTGKVRLLFVADRIPAELRRLVEFLNEKMSDIEVLAVEIKQYAGTGAHTVVVPRVIGMTEKAREKKPAVNSAKTNLEAFLKACPAEAIPVFQRLLTMADERAYTIYWGKVGFSIRPLIGGALTSVLYGWPLASPPTRIEFYTGYLKFEPAALATVRAEIVNMDTFTLSGEHTYRAPITPVTAARVEAALPVLFDLIERLAGGQ